ncbi:unnamed protein product [Protopolystoma xenopodis]|uniref:WW domain-containing protein n=1 Tax=Protopolystoma xenopodis TaxID=117903 RepID=A0A448XKE9_9PLAT|nr:unnamed protein product [Protopolystoma xenopodis]
MDRYSQVYYVDHNTRTTTWLRPSSHLLDNVAQWQEWRTGRSNAMATQLRQRYAASVWTPPSGTAPAMTTCGQSIASTSATVTTNTAANGSAAVTEGMVPGQLAGAPDRCGPLPKGWGMHSTNRQITSQ